MSSCWKSTHKPDDFGTGSRREDTEAAWECCQLLPVAVNDKDAGALPVTVVGNQPSVSYLHQCRESRSLTQRDHSDGLRREPEPD
jgi:hypothetical protein